MGSQRTAADAICPIFSSWFVLLDGPGLGFAFLRALARPRRFRKRSREGTRRYPQIGSRLRRSLHKSGPPSHSSVRRSETSRHFLVRGIVRSVGGHVSSREARRHFRSAGHRGSTGPPGTAPYPARRRGAFRRQRSSANVPSPERASTVDAPETGCRQPYRNRSAGLCGTTCGPFMTGWCACSTRIARRGAHDMSERIPNFVYERSVARRAAILERHIRVEMLILAPGLMS